MKNELKGMKIVHIITGLNDGGAEAVLHRLIKYDINNNHTVISLMDGGKYQDILREEGFTVYSVGMRRGIPSLSAIFRIRERIKKINPDVVQTWMYHGDLVGGISARLAGIENIVWGLHHTTLDKDKSSRATRVIATVNARLSKFIPVKIICCAESSKKVHDKLGYDNSKTIVITNGYDITQFRIDDESRNRIRKEFGILNDQLVFGTVARFDPQKDHKNIITALQELKKRGHKFTMLFVGPDINDENADLVALRSKANLDNEVLLVGARNDIPSVMNALDIHILGSSHGEAFPNVVCEAMACGTPVAATDVGDCRIIVGDTGAIVPPRSPIQLADAIESMLPNVRSKNVSENVRRRIVENFSLDGMVSGYKGVWFSVICDNRSS